MENQRIKLEHLELSTPAVGNLSNSLQENGKINVEKINDKSMLISCLKEEQESRDFGMKRWSEEQSKQLLELHNLMGNRWTEISKNFPNRNQNCVKNYFYAELRKSIRKLNNFIEKEKRETEDLREFNISQICKMVTILSEKNLKNHPISPVIDNMEADFQKIKKYLFIVLPRQEQFDKFSSPQLIDLINLIGELMDSVKQYNLIKKKKIKNKTIKFPAELFPQQLRETVPKREEISVKNSETQENAIESLNPCWTPMNYFVPQWIQCVIPPVYSPSSILLWQMVNTQNP